VQVVVSVASSVAALLLQAAIPKAKAAAMKAVKKTFFILFVSLFLWGVNPGLINKYI
jgi:hypothetical protein